MVKAKKYLGQNFLVDENIVAQIIRVIDPKKNQRFIEIGAGRGVLTKALLEKGVQLEAIEIDADLIDNLKKLQQQYPKLIIHVQDALEFKMDVESDLRILGNLPYNISSLLLLHYLKQIDSIIDMHFMLQKEVVDRLTAEPGNKDYGRLSVITQYYCQVEKLFEVPPSCFQPEPQVTSAVFRLIPRQDRPKIDIKKLELITQHAFGQRRKTLRNSLSLLFSPEELKVFGIDPSRRAETLSVQEYIKLAT